MKKMTLFKVLVVMVLAVVGIGFYRDWFEVSSGRTGSGGGQVDVNLTVDTDKAQEDAQAVETKAREFAGTKVATPVQSIDE